MEKLINLCVDNVSVTVDKRCLVKDITFSIGQGKVLALVGHNGAGKSTLMNTIVGLLNKTSGNISILQKYNQDKQLLNYKRNLAYLPEEPLLLTELTVMQHFQLYKMSYHIDDNVFSDRLEKLLNGFDLTTKLNEYPESLSKGMRQKTQAICALLPDVPVLLIDEPFIGLDIYAVDFLISIIEKRVKQGTSILLTTHQLDMLQHLADDYVLLTDGRVEEYGAIETFKTIDRGFMKND